MVPPLILPCLRLGLIPPCISESQLADPSSSLLTAFHLSLKALAVLGNWRIGVRIEHGKLYNPGQSRSQRK